MDEFGWVVEVRSRRVLEVRCRLTVQLWSFVLDLHTVLTEDATLLVVASDDECPSRIRGEVPELPLRLLLLVQLLHDRLRTDPRLDGACPIIIRFTGRLSQPAAVVEDSEVEAVLRTPLPSKCRGLLDLGVLVHLFLEASFC